MNTDVWDELGDAEDKLREFADQAAADAERKRHEATLLDGQAQAFRRAADMLRGIERPQ